MQMSPVRYNLLSPLQTICLPCAAVKVGAFSLALVCRSPNCALHLVTSSLLTEEVTNGYFTTEICP